MTICIVTCDIVGPIRNGGIGTAYYSLARLLADAGHRVTVLYALGRYCEQQTIEHWVEAYRAMNIEFVPVPDGDVEVRGHSAMKIAHAVYRWLKGRRFDVVHVHEWRGIAFYALTAKRQGLALQDSLVCVGAHSPVLWHKEGMNELASAEELEVDFMERQSVALADVLWSPSAHMVGWMRREGWQLPKRVMTRQYVVLGGRRNAPAGPVAPVRELVFFGRLETRKGLDVFCDGLDRLVQRGVAVPRVTFLGKPATVGGVPSETYLEERARRWPFRWQIIRDRDRDAALAYLAEPGRLAVLPSRIDNLPYTVLECLAAGVPFLASGTGGIPEMIRDEDRDATLFDLTAASIADHLQRALGAGVRAVKPRVGFDRTNRDWLEWHARARRARPSPPAPAATPLVSIVLTHFNRPRLLAQAIDSIRRQDYPALEVVLVDDGSDAPEAVRYVDSLEEEFDARGWRIVRQPNRYLGAARNAGVREARGAYVLFMDDDNLAEPHEVATFVRAAEASGADILTCFLRVFRGGSGTTDEDTYCWPFLGAAVSPGVTRNSFGDANAFVRRSVFERVGGFTEDVGVGCEDWEFFARATLDGCRLMVLPEPLVRYRQGQGMLSTTSQHANRMRALRPYFTRVPAPFRGLLHLAHAPSAAAAPVPAARLDHVRRAVVFGTGEGGRAALKLAERCGWSVEYLVDNNASVWHTEAHGRGVRPPAALEARDYDLVIVASQAGKAAIFGQLERMGLSHAEHFVHFLEPVSVSGVTAQVVL